MNTQYYTKEEIIFLLKNIIFLKFIIKNIYILIKTHLKSFLHIA